MAKTEVTVPLTGEDGNAMAIIARVSRALKTNGERELAEEFKEKAFQSKSYDEVLQLVMDYVEVE